MNRLPGAWFYERAYCDCSCVIVTAGRKHLQIGEKLYCEMHQRIVKPVRVQAATLAERDELTRVEQEICQSQ